MLIVIEEAWAALMHGRFADRLRQWLLTLRKRNAAVVVVAHSPAQFRDPGVKGAQLLVESCPTRIFLPNPDAAEPDTAALYRWLGLNEAEVSRLSRARKKRDYYVRSPSGARTFDLALGSLEMAFLGTLPGRSADETVREAARLADADGERWPAEWLRLCGLDAEADALGMDETGTPVDGLSSSTSGSSTRGT
jgi:type IV secretion system protein VirB4